jgi:glucoamylase
LLPEQIWDTTDIPEKELYFGKPSGSAMPLGWAHAEYLKLRRSLHDQRAFDLPPQTVQRYQKEKTRSAFATWRFNHKIHALPAGKTLRVECLAPAILTWTRDNWKTTNNQQSTNTGLGVYVIDVPTQNLPAGTVIGFTFYWPNVDHWEGQNFDVTIAPG